MGYGFVTLFIGLLKIVTKIYYGAVVNLLSILQFATALTKPSRSAVLSSGNGFHNSIGSSASVFTFLPAAVCLTDPHGRNSWPCTPSRVWSPLATTHFRLRTRLSCLQILFASSQSHVTTDSQSASQPWCQAPSGAQD
jgi:hypothetical protein